MTDTREKAGIDRQEEHILFPQEVYAFRMGDEPRVTIVARGHEDGYCNIRIVPSQATIYPPIYMVVGEPCAVIGYFPYLASTTVRYSTDLDYVLFQLSTGTQKIPIRDLRETQENLPEALTQPTENQVVGYAYNSTDINIAIQNAVSKLQEKFPGRVSALLKESGFVAVGSPVGIAYYYVVMEQQSS